MRFRALHLFCGIGGGALGFQQAREEWKGTVGRIETLAGIDVDPEACQDFVNITGAPAIRMDLFSREQYRDFHGEDPPPGWEEATPFDIWRATGGEYPDIIFSSPPCKGFSGLLPRRAAESRKYQALNQLTLRGIQLLKGGIGVYTCNFARLRSVPPGLRPVSIARGTPRWFKGLRYEALAPEWEWLRSTREEYDRAFRQRLSQLDPARVYEELGENAVLLCWCRHNAGCHRRLVAEWLEKNLGVVIPEWGYPRSDCRPYDTCRWDKGPLARKAQE